MFPGTVFTHERHAAIGPLERGSVGSKTRVLKATGARDPHTTVDLPEAAFEVTLLPEGLRRSA